MVFCIFFSWQFLKHWFSSFFCSLSLPCYMLSWGGHSIGQSRFCLLVHGHPPGEGGLRAELGTHTSVLNELLLTLLSLNPLIHSMASTTNFTLIFNSKTFLLDSSPVFSSASFFILYFLSQLIASSSTTRPYHHHVLVHLSWPLSKAN